MASARAEKVKAAPVDARAPTLIGPAPLLSGFVDAQGRVEVARVADNCGMSKSQLAETIGLAPEALYKTTRAHAARTQSRIREMLEIVGRISQWAGGKEQAM